MCFLLFLSNLKLSLSHKENEILRAIFDCKNYSIGEKCIMSSVIICAFADIKVTESRMIAHGSASTHGRDKNGMQNFIRKHKNEISV
jgi:hypothetical protein